MAPSRLAKCWKCPLLVQLSTPAPSHQDNRDCKLDTSHQSQTLCTGRSDIHSSYRLFLRSNWRPQTPLQTDCQIWSQALLLLGKTAPSKLYTTATSFCAQVSSPSNREQRSLCLWEKALSFFIWKLLENRSCAHFPLRNSEPRILEIRKCSRNYRPGIEVYLSGEPWVSSRMQNYKPLQDHFFKH